MAIRLNKTEMLLKKLQLKYQKNIVVGWKIFSRKNNGDSVALLKDNLAEIVLRTRKRKSKLILGDAYKDWDVITAQYFISRVLNKYFNALIFLSFYKSARLIYPLPFCVLKKLKNFNINPDKFISFLLWKIAAFVCVAWSVSYLFAINIRYLFLCLSSNRHYNHCSHYFLYGINNTCVPTALSNKSKTIIDWLVNKFQISSGCFFVDFKVETLSICNSINISSQNSLYFVPNSFVGLVKLNFHSFVMQLYSMFNSIIYNDDFHALLSVELVRGYSLKYKRSIAVDRHFFSLSKYLYRPLWTYIVNRKYYDVWLFFYSTNTKPFAVKNKIYKLYKQGFQLCTWENVLTWDVEQSDWVRTVFYKRPIKIEECGSIYLSDCNLPINFRSDKRVIAVFDVQPQNLVNFVLLGIPIEYYRGDAAIQFNKDIYSVAVENNCQLVHKRKRSLNEKDNKKYARVFREFSCEYYTDIPVDVSPIRVIEQSDLVIAMPFTAVVLQAIELGKKVAYYDPNGLIVDPKKYSHGVQVLRSKSQLHEWVCESLDV